MFKLLLRAGQRLAVGGLAAGCTLREAPGFDVRRRDCLGDSQPVKRSYHYFPSTGLIALTSSSSSMSVPEIRGDPLI
jgi:hypothetical protein